MNNKYINYITLQQYTSDPTNQQKTSSHRPILSNISHSTTIYHRPTMIPIQNRGKREVR